MLGMMCFFYQKICQLLQNGWIFHKFHEDLPRPTPFGVLLQRMICSLQNSGYLTLVAMEQTQVVFGKKANPLFIPKFLSGCMPLQPPTKHTSPGISTDKLWLVNLPPQTYPPTIKALFSKGLLTIGSLNKAFLNSYFWGWYVREGLVD